MTQRILSVLLAVLFAVSTMVVAAPTASAEPDKALTLLADPPQGGTARAESPAETVKVKAGFFARLKAFFRGLFKKLPVIAQEYLGVEKTERVLP